MKKNLNNNWIQSFLGLVFVFGFSVETFAAPALPKAVEQFLIQKNQHTLITQWKLLKSPDPEEIYKDFSSQSAKFVGAGFGGVAFKTENGDVYKFSYSVFSKSEPHHSRWGRLVELPVFQNVIAAKKLPLLDLEGFVENATNRKSNELEAVGSLLWALYSPASDGLSRSEVLFDVLSNDGAAYKRRYVEGVPLNLILKDKSNPFNGKKLWEKIDAIQKRAEKMFIETGVMVDLFNPANLIVGGSPDSPSLELIDHEILKGSKQARQFYRNRGLKVARTGIDQSFSLLEWPVMPEHILISSNWGLSFEQAVLFVKVRDGLSPGLKGTLKALKKIAAMKRLEFKVPVSPLNLENVKRARVILNAYKKDRNARDLCSLLLSVE